MKPKVVDSYSYEDQEVSINYNQGTWIIYSNKRTVITDMMKKYGDKLEILEVLESGLPALVRLVTTENVITFRSIKSKEQKEAERKRASERAKKNFGFTSKE